LIALNRAAAPGVTGMSQPDGPAEGFHCDRPPLSDMNSSDFGTREVGLLMTAAGMLAGHARNVALFRAEENLRVGVIETITAALDARDPSTCGHSRRVGRHAARTARHMGCSPEECERIYITGLLHDVGKIGVPDDILKKSDRLTDEEYEIIKQHPVTGHSILIRLKDLAFVLPGVLHHHERMDGHGYPHGLSGEAIPLDARILAVVDSYDAMTSNRIYRNGMNEARALEILRSDAGAQWDKNVVASFLTTLAADT
jgi:HD-GYP domain-containing protein (c-di-GMP phosphodiesterase class II)